MTCCLHVAKWLHTWIFYISLIARILVRTVKLTFTQAENQIWTIYTLEMFLYITRCDMTSPISLSEIDLYSFIENPVAETLSPANWISTASAFICSQKMVWSACSTAQPLFDAPGFSCH